MKYAFICRPVVTLIERVGEFLLAVAHDVLFAALMLEDDRAVVRTSWSFTRAGCLSASTYSTATFLLANSYGRARRGSAETRSAGRRP